jgi:hypothetical protein
MADCIVVSMASHAALEEDIVQKKLAMSGRAAPRLLTKIWHRCKPQLLAKREYR